MTVLALYILYACICVGCEQLKWNLFASDTLDYMCLNESYENPLPASSSKLLRLISLFQQSAQIRLDNALPSSWLQKSRLLGDVNEDTLFKCSMTVATSQLHSCCLPVLLFSDGTVCIR